MSDIETEATDQALEDYVATDQEDDDMEVNEQAGIINKCV